MFSALPLTPLVYHRPLQKSITFSKNLDVIRLKAPVIRYRKTLALGKIIGAFGAGSSGVSCFRRHPYHPQPQGESSQALVRHSHPDSSHRGREHRRPYRNAPAPYCRPLSSPHLVTRLYHGNPKKSMVFPKNFP